MSEAPTLDQIREQASQCSACGLAVRRTHVVFGEGNPNAPLVLVGEGPGENEDKTGRPFVGLAGQVLDRALLDNGLNRDDVYICNIVKCRACDWKGKTAYNRPPTPQETESCAKWLHAQLGAIRPKVLLCIGSPSANKLIRKGFQITKERGQIFSCEFAPVAIATLHPAYILRQRGQRSDGGYSLLVEDIALAWMHANFS